MFSIYYSNLSIQTVSTGKAVLFSIPIGNELLTKFVPVFMVSYFYAVNRNVVMDVWKDVVSTQTVRDLAEFFYIQYLSNSFAISMLVSLSSMYFKMQVAVRVLNVSKTSLCRHDVQGFETGNRHSN